jgi:hypothetical protein
MLKEASQIPIDPPAFDAVASFGIVLIAVVVAGLYVVLLARGGGKRLAWLTLGALALLGASAAAAISGLLSRFDVLPPPMAIMVLSVLAISFALGFSKLGGEVAAERSFAALVGIQSFRLPLELVMHHAYEKGIMPVQLSYSGYNFDIVTGIGALILGILLFRGAAVPRWAIWAWNLWGLYCLAAILFVAVAGSPMVRLFGDESRDLNTWVLFFPYPWLPVILVTVAISGHILVTRKLLRE